MKAADAKSRHVEMIDLPIIDGKLDCRELSTFCEQWVVDQGACPGMAIRRIAIIGGGAAGIATAK